MPLTAPAERSPHAATLRACLREATAPLHDRLDAAMGVLDLAIRADYVRFLRVQLAARTAIEPVLGALDGPPPAQAALLRADLAALGADGDAAPVRFDLPAGADPIGAFWALAGSHLGNLAMLRDLGDRAPHSWPTAFLSDPRMAAYWRTFREKLARPARAADPAIAAGQAVFATFLAATMDELAGTELAGTELAGTELASAELTGAR